jgi:thioesterase domain-containing protein
MEIEQYRNNINSIRDFLIQLHNQGINLWLEGESLRFSAPQGVMTDAIKSEIRAYKPEIIAFLQQEKSANDNSLLIPKIDRNSSNDSCVVTINDNGDKCPLYFINSTTVAYKLQDYLGKNQPLYSLNIFGLTTRINKPFSQLTISDLATYMIQDLLEFKSEDKYQLIGYCQDGPLTLEIAQQIKKLGKKIELLCLVDVSFDRNKKQRNKFFNRLQMIRDFKLVYFQPRIKRYLSKITNKFNFTQKSNQSREDKELQKKISLDQQLYQNYYQLFRSYKPSGYDGEIVSIESKEFSLVDHPTLKLIAKQGLKSETVNTTHHSLFESHIDLFAQILKKYL